MTSWHFDLFALCLLISSTACLGASRSAQSCTSIKRQRRKRTQSTHIIPMLWTHPESRGSCGHVLILSCPGLLTNEHVCATAPTVTSTKHWLRYTDEVLAQRGAIGEKILQFRLGEAPASASNSFQGLPLALLCLGRLQRVEKRIVIVEADLI